MDPGLRELLLVGSPGDTLEAIVRLSPGVDEVPRGAFEVARFADIRTVRTRRSDIERLWASEEVASVKAPRLLQVDAPVSWSGASRPAVRRPRGIHETGRGVVFGCIDWGFDVFHPAFRGKGIGGSPSTRVGVLWDQRERGSSPDSSRVRPYGYGRVIDRSEIERALGSPKPYANLGYHPGDSDRGSGAHGTHVASIAAGSRRKGGDVGVAPEAELAFVHLASGPLGGLADLGDSVRILEAVDFILRYAAGRPVVINLSLGRHGGSHTGQSLVERALDSAVSSRPGITIVQSAGNYGASNTHASGVLKPGDQRTLGWHVRPGAAVHDELEIWYANRDRFDFSLRLPGATHEITARLGEARVLYDGRMREIGRLYHRAFDPNSPDHQIDVLLRRSAPGGLWLARLSGREVSDGRFGAWIERDPEGRRGQSRFRAEDVDPTGTIGSIANTHLTITVSAADHGGPFITRASFASRGPTRDGRPKPDLLAPGVRIPGARSTPRERRAPLDLTARMSGASQAAPYVAGVAALCQQAGGGLVDAHEMRRILIGTARPLDTTGEGPRVVDLCAAVQQARSVGKATRAKRSTASSYLSS